MVGNHLPRHCGIATFTTDLTDAITAEASAVECFVVAMNDVGSRHAYPPRVRVEIAEGDAMAYHCAADELNASSVDVVSLQHEYGIFGPNAGSNVLELLRGLHMPVVTTLHTILASPTSTQRNVMDALIERSERLVVMSHDGSALLQRVHGVDADKIDVIPHGIPSVSTHEDPIPGLENRFVILTFGLLSPDKGIEDVIDALPEIVARHPRTVYVVLGATHPHVKQHHGETYRRSLEKQAERIGVRDNVIFENRFVEHHELVSYLAAADIYVTPYLKEEQSTSGTLAYAVGCGKAVISTPYRYAVEMLAEARGILVPCRDPQTIAREVIGLLDDPAKRSLLQERAALFGKAMSWPIVARTYLSTFDRAHRSAVARDAATLPPKPLAEPTIDLSHLRRLTDDTGVLQHATFSVPRRDEGYCTDDNARALLVMTLLEDEQHGYHDGARSLSSRYLAFLDHAWNPANGRFRNFMTYGRAWCEDQGSDDSHGRALWALGAVAGRSRDPGWSTHARCLFERGLTAVPRLTSPRAWAYALLGIDEYRARNEDDFVVETIGGQLAQKLVDCFHASSAPQWPWFEDRLTYCNARLPQALIRSACWLDSPEMQSVGVRALEWLVAQNSAPGGTFAPVGSDGFYIRGEARAAFDQQPVEAGSIVSACLDAARVTGDERWFAHARRAFDWFYGDNVLQKPLIDAVSGGCRDGIHAERLNENQGAESTLSFLMALLEMRAAANISWGVPLPTEKVTNARVGPIAPASHGFKVFH